MRGACARDALPLDEELLDEVSTAHCRTEVILEREKRPDTASFSAGEGADRKCCGSDAGLTMQGEKC